MIDALWLGLAGVVLIALCYYMDTLTDKESTNGKSKE